MHTLTAEPAPEAATHDTVECDLSRRFVRVLREQPDCLVAFEFSIGWPDLAVELAMPRPLFEAFCQRHGVVHLSAEEASAKLGASGDNDGDDA